MAQVKLQIDFVQRSSRGLFYTPALYMHDIWYHFSLFLFWVLLQENKQSKVACNKSWFVPVCKINQETLDKLFSPPLGKATGTRRKKKRANNDKEREYICRQTRNLELPNPPFS